MRLFKGIVLALAVVFMAVNLSACGYSASGANLPAGIKTIHVSPFKNRIDITSEVTTFNRYRSYRPLLEVDIRNSVIDRFLLDGALKIDNSENADWILEGELVEFRKDALKYGSDDETVREYRINIVVNLSLFDREGRIIWGEPGFTGDTTYFTQGANAKSEVTAIDDALTDLARRIVERVVEDW
ncbi:MAG: LptE family protein [Candidatus Gygaella obscura]|nr:LptE family protein [Candidatus Gygaella obscura]